MLEWFERVGYSADIAGLEREFGRALTKLPDWASRHAPANGRWDDSRKDRMKVVRLLEYGGQLLFEDLPMPTIARDEILVKVKSTTVNHVDLVKASGALRQILPIELPWIPGHEFSGVVEQIGSDVGSFAPGDAVFGSNTGMGAYAEYLATKAAAIAQKPSNLSFEQAASVPVAAQTAWEGIFTHGHLEKGQTILIHAGAGAVGAYAVQLASDADATVIATASGDDEAYVKSIGASRVINYGGRHTEAVVPRLEGRRPSRLCRPAGLARRRREASCLGHDDEADAVSGDAWQNRATAGRHDYPTRRRGRVRTSGCGPGMEGLSRKIASRTWDAAWEAGNKTQVTRKDRASCGLDIEIFMTNRIHELLHRNLQEVFGEGDAARRRAAINELYTEDCVLEVPLGAFIGRDALDKFAGDLRATHPQFHYTPLSEPQALHNAGRLAWGSGPHGEAPEYTGLDVIVVRDGRIAALYVFLDSRPQ
jgi:hypothetical protein